MDLNKWNIPTLKLSDGLIAVGVLAASYVIYWTSGYFRVRREVKGLPTIHSWIEFFESGARQKIPHIPFISPVKDFTLEEPYQKYENVQSDLIALTQVTTSHAVYITSNPTTAAQISSKSDTFLKPTSMFRYQAINIFGLQIVSAQTGVEHRRHKNVAKGCFNEEYMEIGWEKMVKAFEIMVRAENLGDGGVWRNVKTCMIKATLLVIGEAGFSISIPWNIPHTDGPILPFEEALDIVETTMIPQLLLPLVGSEVLVMGEVDTQKSLIHHIKSMLKSRRAQLTIEMNALPAGEEVKPPKDILGALVASQMEVEDEAKLGKGESKVAGLTDKEIIGNTFIFIVAGHETSGHTLTWVLGYIALFPKIQEEIYQELVEVCGDSLPYVNKLSYTLATIYESLRLRDLVMTIPKLAAEDTTLPYTTWDSTGQITRHSFPIKKGSHVIIDSPACQRNPQYWTNPNEFDPTRHLGENRVKKGKGYTGFSMGMRQCIGKRFAEVEMLAMVSHVVKTFILSPIALKGETFEDTRKRYEKGNEELSFTPDNWDIKLERRV